MSRREQRALTLSIYGVSLVAVGSTAYGLYLASDAVILNGIFSFLSLVAGGLKLLAAKLVARPEDSRFPYGYSHMEPLVQSVNGCFVLIICLYSFLNGVERIRGGGHAVDAHGVIWFGIVSAAVCLGFWVYESSLARRLDSGLLRNDAQEWLVDFVFSVVTLAGFAVLPFLAEPHRSAWARYADPALVSLMGLLLVPIPLRMLRQSLREVLLMTEPNDALTGRLQAVLEQLQGELDIVRCVHRVVKSGRTHFVEIDIVVGPDFALQTIPQQDRLRERIWAATDLSIEKAWVSICLTADPRWV